MSFLERKDYPAMSKKIICLLLALVLSCGLCLTGCSKENNEQVNAEADTEESSRVAMTISLWMPTDNDTTEEAKTLVSEAINKITKAKFNTAIDLHLVARDEYQETIDEKIEKVADARIEKELAEEEERLAQKNKKAGTSAQEESEIEDIGEISEYPTVAEDQLDIFFVSGYDNYMRYIDGDIISSLDGELSSGSKLLKSYIYPHFLEIVSEYGVYGIPNNHPVGEYKYLLINKELVDKYDYDIDNFTTLIRCKSFILDMGNQNLPGLIPLLGPVEPSGVTYFGTDPAEWSVIASQYGDDVAYNKEVAPDNILANGAYTNLYTFLRQLDELGYIGDGTLDEDEYFAVGVVAGDAALAKEYEDEYYVRIHENPICNEDDVFSAMFCVSTYTKNLSRAMEIVTYLNTKQDLRTILQYGVEGVHWEYEDDTEETIHMISDDYKMELNETGNVYMTYPGEGISMDYWEIEKQQNLDSVSYPYIKFPGYINEKNLPVLEKVAEYSKEIKARLDACPSEELASFIRDLKKEVANNKYVKEMLDPENEDSVYKIYIEWHSDLYPF